MTEYPPETKPQTTDEIAGAVRYNLCHENCVCSDSNWCVQELAADEIERLKQELASALGQ